MVIVKGPETTETYIFWYFILKRHVHIFGSFVKPFMPWTYNQGWTFISKFDPELLVYARV